MERRTFTTEHEGWCESSFPFFTRFASTTSRWPINSSELHKVWC